MKKLFLVLTVLLVLLIPSFAFAAADYTISQEDIKINVNENNTYDITENVTAEFPEFSAKHGITRTIPTDVELSRRIDGNVVKSRYHAIISNIESDGPYHTESGDAGLTIYFGDADLTVSGTQNYNYSYRYDMGDDGLSSMDEFYFNLIGSDNPVPIDGMTFEITMPKEFDASKVGFTTGSSGNTGYNESALKYTVEGNTIKGSINQTIAPYEAVTIRIELPNGYFVGARSAQSFLMPCILIGLVVFVIVILLFVTAGKKKREVQTVEFYPPEGMNPADVGYIIDGIVENKDAVSLLIYWADQGNLEIHQEDKKNVSFKKIKDLPDTANDYERILFDKMFSGRESISVKDMQYTFSDTIAAVKSRIKDKYEMEQNRVFTKKSLRRQSFAGAFAAFPMALMLAFSIYLDSYELFAAIIPCAIAWVFGWVLTSGLISNVNKWKSEKLSTRTGSMVLFTVLTLVYIAVVSLMSFDLFGMMVIVPTAMTIVMMILATQMRRRTERGAQWAGRILGLKHFIETVEADKLKMLVNDDPKYFYNVLPYAYVLGVSDKWAKQFESIAVEPPSWYYGYNGSVFTTIWFASMLSNTMYYTQQTMSATKESSGGGIGGGGGFGGGGFSGGGGGGGSFGSW